MKNESLILLEAIDEGINKVLDVLPIRYFQTGDVIINNREPLKSLFLLSSGVCQISWDGLQKGMEPRVGVGSVLGDVSFLLGGSARAKVVALEPVECFELSHDSLEFIARDSPNQASRIYRALAKINAQRLITQTHLESVLPYDKTQWLDPAINKAIEKFKHAAAEFEEKRSHSNSTNDVKQKLAREFNCVVQTINELFPARSGAEPATKCASLQFIRTELLPYLLLTRTAERMYRKPRGYAGDFLTIKWMYTDQPGGSGELGRYLDRCFLNQPAAQAVRNRRILLHEEIEKALLLTKERPLRVTSLACGPAEEVFDLFTEPKIASQLELTLVDIDQEALNHIKVRLNKEGVNKYFQRPIKLERRNLLHLCVGRQTLDLPPQHLIYSIGLIDYFDDRIVTQLQKWIYQSLTPGGRSILGNFHINNPSRGLMDHLLDWRLIHRDEVAMKSLAESGGYSLNQTQLRLEPSGVNLFAISTR